MMRLLSGGDTRVTFMVRHLRIFRYAQVLKVDVLEVITTCLLILI